MKKKIYILLQFYPTYCGSGEGCEGFKYLGVFYDKDKMIAAGDEAVRKSGGSDRYEWKEEEIEL